MIRYIGAYEEKADFEDLKIRATHCKMWRNFLGLEQTISIKALGPWVKDCRLDGLVALFLKVHVVYYFFRMAVMQVKPIMHASG